MMRIFNYCGDAAEIDVDLDDPHIVCATMKVLSGDEVLSVLYDEGSEREFDAAIATGVVRLDEYYDDGYVIVVNGAWMVDRERFMGRKGSYEIGSYEMKEHIGQR